MKSVHKSLFAIMTVAIMFLGAIAVTVSAEESDADFGPKKYYKYVMTYSAEKITQVDVYDSSAHIHKTITTLGTSVGEIMNDLGTYSMPRAIAISASGSTATVESEGMQITVGWLSFMNLAIIMILIILAVLAIFIAVRRNPNKG